MCLVGYRPRPPTRPREQLRVEYEDDDQYEYDFEIFKIINPERGTLEPLLLFEECIFNRLHPLGRVGDFKGRAVFLVVIVQKIYFNE